MLYDTFYVIWDTEKFTEVQTFDTLASAKIFAENLIPDGYSPKVLELLYYGVGQSDCRLKQS